MLVSHALMHGYSTEEEQDGMNGYENFLEAFFL